MVKERRKLKRYQVKLEIKLTLYDAEAEEHLIEPAPAVICNISRGGAVLELSEVIRQGKHLFFAPLESDTIQFNLVVPVFQGEQAETVELLAKPVWFNRDMAMEERSFLIGIEFQERLSRQLADHLSL